MIVRKNWLLCSPRLLLRVRAHEAGESGKWRNDRCAQPVRGAAAERRTHLLQNAPLTLAGHARPHPPELGSEATALALSDI